MQRAEESTWLCAGASVGGGNGRILSSRYATGFERWTVFFFSLKCFSLFYFLALSNTKCRRRLVRRVEMYKL